MMHNSLEKLKAANEALKNKLAEQISLQTQTDAIARLSEENPDPVMRVSTQGAVLYANFAAIGLLTSLEIDIGDRLPEGWLPLIDEAGSSKNAIDKEIECGDNFYILTLQPVVDADYINIYGRDITKSKETEHQIVNFDDLTGLPNRVLFQDRLEQALVLAQRSGKLAAVHLVDLDHFKDINETMGHQTGDILLQRIAERLRRCVRASDTVARLGSDEFGIIQVEPVNTDGVSVLAQKLLNCFANPFGVDGREIHINASIGITVFPNDAENPEQALRNAKLALDHGKGEGRGSYHFFVSKMHEDIQRRRSIEDDMREGLHRGEFMLHYQPKLNIATNRITGMEALVRWKHPQQGFISPAEFIPVAERSKLIVPLGEWVLHEACSRNKALTDDGLGPIKVAVNISAVQLQETDLKELVQGVLENTGLDPSQLELEITESLVMNNAEASIELFKELFDLGVSISIDDFGTGYSSLAYLRNFPVQRIKIDKAFVDDIGTGDNPGVIAKAVTTLGHSFSMEITAEGVETEDQFCFLRSLGCDEIQGYFFSRPLPDEELEVFLKNYEKTWALKLRQGRGDSFVERRGSGIDRRFVSLAQTSTS
ncbi:MAG: EAL domain-containing protein [Rhodospirillales bacterium]